MSHSVSEPRVTFHQHGETSGGHHARRFSYSASLYRSSGIIYTIIQDMYVHIREQVESKDYMYYIRMRICVCVCVRRK